MSAYVCLCISLTTCVIYVIYIFNLVQLISLCPLVSQPILIKHMSRPAAAEQHLEKPYLSFTARKFDHSESTF